nr:DUF4241 domain-containing protein [Helicobacter pylori]
MELLKHLFLTSYSVGFLGELVACDPLTTIKAREPLSFNP